MPSAVGAPHGRIDARLANLSADAFASSVPRSKANSPMVRVASSDLEDGVSKHSNRFSLPSN